MGNCCDAVRCMWYGSGGREFCMAGATFAVDASGILDHRS
jgi:hypothetical protein